MKYIVLILISILMMSCRKDTTSTTDITIYEWSMVSFSDGKKKRITKKDHQYSLLFSQDSKFYMNTSVNLAIGGYEIVDKGNVLISSYESITEVGGENETDKRLLKLFPKMTSYKVIGSFLYFENNKQYIKFKKK